MLKFIKGLRGDLLLYLLAIAAGILLGLLAKGSLANFLHFRFKRVWLALTAVLIDVMIQVLALNGFEFTIRYSFAISAVKFLLLLVWLWTNREILGIPVIGLGCLLNAVVMMVNDGKMPVDENVIKAVMAENSGITEVPLDGKHFIADSSTKLPFLSDTIHPPGFLAIGAQIMSIGDLIVVAGILLVAYKIVSGRPDSGKNKYGKTSVV